MKRIILTVLVVTLLGVGAYFGAGSLAAGNEGTTADSGIATGSTGEPISSTGDVGGGNGSGTGLTADPNQPDRTAEVKGVVLSVDGTNVVVDHYLKDPSEELTEEEKAARRAERSQLTQAERQALKAAENAELETVRVTVIIPVGTPIVQMALVDGESAAMPATLSAIRSGMEVTVWTDGGTDGATAQYVKIASAK